jgi:diguanylate cyclase (GGDEF)-like protein/PAS domain S-box-containing protein
MYKRERLLLTHAFAFFKRLTPSIALLLIASHSALAETTMQKVSIQLLWYHQFEFAGYYAALDKDFYSDAGLDVTLKEGSPNVSPINEVVQGRADFGVSSSGLVKSYLEGKPVLMLAPIIQHSPEVLLSITNHLNSPNDFAKAGAIGLQPGDESLDLKAMFVNEGIALDKLQINSRAHGLDDLLAGKIIATNAYLSNETFLLKKRGIPYTIIKPSHYGMDFYNGILFTSNGMNVAHPEAVAAFRAATLKGWEYALTHQDEIINLILSQYNTQGKSREHLAFEAKSLTDLISSDMIQLGHSNPWRWRHITETYAKLGVVKPDFNLDDFFYDPTPQPQDNTWLYRLLLIALLIIIVITAIALYVHRINRKLKLSEENLKLVASVFTHAHEGILITDLEGGIIDVNAMFSRITGYAKEDVIGKTPGILSSGKHGTEYYKAMWKKLIEHGYWHDEIWNKRKNGEIYAAMQTISSVLDTHGKAQHYVALFSEITERKQMEEQVHQLAFYDPLTQLPNRRLLADRLCQTFAASKRSHLYGALIFLDLDNFKPLNDTHGHAAGDILLIEVANRLKSCVRDMDTVARFGGDEFIIILTELLEDKAESIKYAKIVADKILSTLSAPYALTIHHDTQTNILIEHHCTSSIGLAVFNGNEDNQDDAMKWADTAMYKAKQAGRNQIWLYRE